MLEDAGIRLVSVAPDILEVSGRDMLEALVQDTTDPEMLAELARGCLRAKLPAWQQTMIGQFRRHHISIRQGVENVRLDRIPLQTFLPPR